MYIVMGQWPLSNNIIEFVFARNVFKVDNKALWKHVYLKKNV